MYTSAGSRVSLARRRSLVALAAALSLVSVPAVASSAAAVPDQSRTSALSAPAVPTLATAPADGSDTPVETTEIDLAGVDPDAASELVSIDEASPENFSAAVDPETEPGLEVENPLGALPDEVAPEVITEKMSAEPFSVMGVTWDLDASLEDVVVQYRTFREGAWSDWGWVGATEEYAETADGSQASRGATDPVFVPDSTGVQLVVSSSTGTVSGVKVVLINPGSGPDGTGASESSGEPTDTDSATPTPTPTPSPTPTPTPSPDEDTGSPAPAPVPSEDPSVSPESPGPSEPPSSPAPEPSEPGASDAPTDGGAEGDEPAPAEPGGAPAPGDAAGDGGGAVSGLSMPAASIAMPAMVSRVAWGAAAPVCQVDYGQELRAAAIHHTASTNTYAQSQVPGMLRGFAEFHMRPEAAGGRGWCDIGYNFLVDKFGVIYEGRGGGIDLPVVGVHTGGFNSRIVGVSAIGNYEEAVPSAALNESISRVIAWKLAQHRVEANTTVTLISGGGASKYPAGTPVALNTIFGHLDAQYTSCPGRHLVARFGDIRNRVAVLGNQVASESPQGAWDVLQGGGNSVRVSGWTRDPSSPAAAVRVQVIVDGVVTSTISASQNRSDVGPHGFDASVAVAPGRHVVCLRYLNVGGGNDIMVGCRTATATASNPLGVIDGVSATATTVSVRGWARDPDSPNPISVHVYLDGKAVRAATANGLRPDVERSAPGQAGPRHGFSVQVPATAGRHTVCVYGINVGPGSNTSLGCRQVNVVNRAPIGSVDVVRSSGGDSFIVRGWVLDPDTSDSVQAHVYVDGRATRAVRANLSRPDVGRIHGLGDAHGFAATVPATAGRHEVCVYGIDSARGFNPRIGCRTVTVVNTAPKGALDLVSSGSGQVRVRGWAFDPDTTASIDVHVYVDGRLTTGLRASGDRPDVARVHKRGAAHGFDSTVMVAAGRHEICVYAINRPAGPNPRLGCSSVTVA